MTQKELLYLEDAVSHEQIIIESIINTNQYLEDENLISFMEERLSEHEQTKDRLVNLLEEKVNE